MSRHISTQDGHLKSQRIMEPVFSDDITAGVVVKTNDGNLARTDHDQCCAATLPPHLLMLSSTDTPLRLFNDEVAFSSNDASVFR